MTGSTPIDYETLRQLQADLGGDPDVIIEFITMFLDDTPGQFTLARQALEQGHYPQILQYIHTAKSAAALIGAHMLADQCQITEDMLRNEQRVDATRLNATLTTIEQLYAESAQQLQRLRANIQAGVAWDRM